MWAHKACVPSLRKVIWQLTKRSVFFELSAVVILDPFTLRPPNWLLRLLFGVGSSFRVCVWLQDIKMSDRIWKTPEKSDSTGNCWALRSLHTACKTKKWHKNAKCPGQNSLYWLRQKHRKINDWKVLPEDLEEGKNRLILHWWRSCPHHGLQENKEEVLAIPPATN